MIDTLTSVFPGSLWLLSQSALLHYHLRDYDQAQSLFQDIRARDPHRVSHMDIYSNILYVKEDRANLSHLAHALSKIDKFAPETCCVIGNYYSLKGQHDRSILYFQRALRLHKGYSSAYTLMGHEYIELRNTAAAIECYRKAVDLSALDYRAWYGLGQTYEMLHLYQYGLYYFQKAAALRPDDARMWCAVGNCHHKLGSNRDAARFYEKALELGDAEGVATRELARLYKEEDMLDKAAEVYRRFLDEGRDEGMGEVLGSRSRNVQRDHENAEGILFLASYYRGKGRFDMVHGYCSRLLDAVGPEGEEAKAMLRELRSLGDTMGDLTNEGIGSLMDLSSGSAENSFERARLSFSSEVVSESRSGALRTRSRRSSASQQRDTWSNRLGNESSMLSEDRDFSYLSP